VTNYKRLIVVLGILFLGVMPVWGAEIHDAAKKGDIERVEALLAETPEQVNAKDENDETPLHLAVRRGYNEVIGLLLAQGADVNAKNEAGVTPLHTAVQEGYKEVVRLLVAKGADVNAKTNKGDTPLYEAVRQGDKEVVQLLPMSTPKPTRDTRLCTGRSGEATRK